MTVNPGQFHWIDTATTKKKNHKSKRETEIRGMTHTRQGIKGNTWKPLGKPGKKKSKK